MRNVKIGYIIAACRNAWFWLGIWIFYYLQYTDYAGIGLIEAIVFGGIVLLEIPTGVFGDLWGKRVSVILGLVIDGIGTIGVGLANSFNTLLIALPFLAMGSAFFSGSYEAIIYDSLKEEGREQEYDKVIANTRTIALLSWAVAGIIGGYLYTISPRLPYYLTGGTMIIGGLCALLLREPSIDTEKYHIGEYFKQFKEGFRTLFRSSFRVIAMLLVVVGVAAIIFNQVLDTALGVAFGLNETQMGWLVAVIFVTAAVLTQLTDKLISWFGKRGTFLLTGVGLAMTLIISPFAGMILGIVSLILRASFHSINSNAVSVLINDNTESRYRATTLSTYSMLTTLPYIVSAVLIGALMDQLGAKVFAMWLGIILALVIVPAGLMLAKNKIKTFGR